MSWCLVGKLGLESGKTRGIASMKNCGSDNECAVDFVSLGTSHGRVIVLINSLWPSMSASKAKYKALLTLRPATDRELAIWS